MTTATKEKGLKRLDIYDANIELLGKLTVAKVCIEKLSHELGDEEHSRLIFGSLDLVEEVIEKLTDLNHKVDSSTDTLG